MIKVVDAIKPGDLTKEVHVELSEINGHPVVVIARDDYYYSGGVCYSQMELTREDVLQILALFPTP